jgi:anti-anti-sigma factor
VGCNDVLPERFAMSQEVENGGVRIRLRGELDLACAPLLESELHRAMGQAIILDLGELSFIDVAGLRTILSAERQARQEDQVVTLVDGSRPVRKLFQLTGNECLFNGGLGAVDHG